MCRERNREPAWVGAIRLALARGELTAGAVVEEANLPPGKRRTVEDVLTTMADREMLVHAADFEESGRYLIGPVLRRRAPSPAAIGRLSKRATHRWGGETGRSDRPAD